eukprot:Rhum_TRINITY_DN24817_c0_g1::Rhum_TRINITY_DN24817_c0_g1_i1::g.180208::m.180208
MEPLMPDECVAQHEHHLSQVAALEAMWAKRLDSVVDDNRVREEGLKSENLRLQGVAREQRVNRLTQLKGLSDDVAQFSHRHKNQDSMISVPFLLQHLERLTNGLVAYPEKHIIAAPDTPSPSQAPPRKRRFGEDETITDKFPVAKPIKRGACAMDTDEGIDEGIVAVSTTHQSVRRREGNTL